MLELNELIELELDSTELLHSINSYGYTYCIANNLLSEELVIKMIENQISELKTRILELKIQLHELLEETYMELDSELYESRAIYRFCLCGGSNN